MLKKWHIERCWKALRFREKDEVPENRRMGMPNYQHLNHV